MTNHYPLPSNDHMVRSLRCYLILHFFILIKSYGQPKQRLPIELVTNISSFLVHTSSLRILARLIQVSRLVFIKTRAASYIIRLSRNPPSHTSMLQAIRMGLHAVSRDTRLLSILYICDA